MGQAKHQQRRYQRPHECRTGDQQAAQARQHGRQGTNRGAAGKPKHVGVGQRVTQQHLHQRPGHGQQPAHRKGRERPWQAQFHHQGARQRIALPLNHAPELSHGKRGAAHRQRKQQRRHGHQGQQAKGCPAAQRHQASSRFWRAWSSLSHSSCAPSSSRGVGRWISEGGTK